MESSIIVLMIVEILLTPRLDRRMMKMNATKSTRYEHWHVVRHRRWERENHTV